MEKLQSQIIWSLGNVQKIKKTLILTFKSKVIMKIKTYVKFKSLEGFSATFGDLGLL